MTWGTVSQNYVKYLGWAISKGQLHPKHSVLPNIGYTQLNSFIAQIDSLDINHQLKLKEHVRCLVRSVLIRRNRVLYKWLETCIIEVLTIGCCIISTLSIHQTQKQHKNSQKAWSIITQSDIVWFPLCYLKKVGDVSELEPHYCVFTIL